MDNQSISTNDVSITNTQFNNQNQAGMHYLTVSIVPTIARLPSQNHLYMHYMRKLDTINVKLVQISFYKCRQSSDLSQLSSWSDLKFDICKSYENTLKFYWEALDHGFLFDNAARQMLLFLEQLLSQVKKQKHGTMFLKKWSSMFSFNMKTLYQNFLIFKPKPIDCYSDVCLHFKGLFDFFKQIENQASESSDRTTPVISSSKSLKDYPKQLNIFQNQSSIPKVSFSYNKIEQNNSGCSLQDYLNVRRQI